VEAQSYEGILIYVNLKAEPGTKKLGAGGRTPGSRVKRRKVNKGV
jgi:hypothetical protein